MSEKIQKVLARAGVASRREIERLLAAGEVVVNGKVATLGDRVEGDEQFRVEGKLVSRKAAQPQPRRILLYHKPVGEICSRNDPEGRKSVFEALPPLQGSRWIAIGRLDLNTSGLLLFTTDGELANTMMHPSSEIEREYAVRILGEVKPEVITQLLQGVELEDGPGRFHQIKDGGGDGANHWYHVVLREGKNREVRRLWESQGVTVSRLMRIRFGSVALPRRLRSGRWEEMAPAETRSLCSELGLASPSRPSRSGKGRRPPSTAAKTERSGKGKPGRRFSGPGS
ncbi:MAG: pseudouridine synthase [Gammaproteobacteria bacterium]|nr:pseudouridine synthase [Gammaproteobacteria bacterium]